MGKIGYDTDGGGTPLKGTAEWAEQQENSAQDVGNAPKGTYAATFGEEQSSTQTETPVTSTDVENTGAGTSTDTEKPAAGATADNVVGGTSKGQTQGGVATADIKQTVSTDIEQKPAAATTQNNNFQPDFSGIDNNIRIMQEAQKQYEQYNETPEQKAKREKRERSKRIVAAVGDGLRALSNLYFTSQYAPNMYNHEKDSASKALDARLEKLNKEREAGRDKYLHYALNIGKLEQDKANMKAQTAKDERDFNYRAGRDKVADDRYNDQKEYQRGRDAAADAYRDKVFDYNQKKDERNFNENQRQFDASLAETRRAHNLTYSASLNRTAHSGSGKGKGATGAYTIRLGDGNTYEYDKKYSGALTNLLPQMIDKARAASLKYGRWTEKGQHYWKMAEQMSKATGADSKLAAVVSNVWDFPSLQEDVRKIIGAPEAKPAATYDPSKYKRGQQGGQSQKDIDAATTLK